MWFPQDVVADFLFEQFIKYYKYISIDDTRLPNALASWVYGCNPRVKYVTFIPIYGNGNVEWAAHGWEVLDTEKIWTGRFWALNKDVARCEM